MVLKCQNVFRPNIFKDLRLRDGREHQDTVRAHTSEQHNYCNVFTFWNGSWTSQQPDMLLTWGKIWQIAKTAMHMLHLIMIISFWDIDQSLWTYIAMIMLLLNVLDKTWYSLVFGISTLCFYHDLYSPRHALYQILTDRCSNHLPLLLYMLPKLQYPLWGVFILS